MGVTNFQSVISAQTVGTADIDKLAASFDKLSGSIDTAASNSKKISEHPGFDSFAEKIKSGIENPLGAAGDAVEGLLKTMGPMGAGVAAGAGIFAAVGVAAFEAAESLGAYATQIQNVSLRTGLTTKEVGQFSFAAQVAGQDVSVFEGAMRKLSQGLADGTSTGKKTRDELKALGIQAADSTGAARPMSDVFVQISERLTGMHDTAERNTAALNLFGRAGIELIPTMIGLADNLQRAKELGLGVDETSIKQWEQYHRQVVEVEFAWESLKRSVAVPLAAIFSVSVNWAGKAISNVDDFSHLFGQLLFGGTATPTDNEMAQTKGYGYGANESRSGHAAQLRLIAENDARVAAARGGDEHEQLTEAKRKLAELQTELKTGTADSHVNDKTFAEIDAQKAVVAGIEAQIKATKDLATAKEHLLELDKRSSFTVAGAAGSYNQAPSNWDQLNKYIEAQRKIETYRAADLQKDPQMAAGINLDYDRQRAAELIKFQAEVIKDWQKFLDDADKGVAALDKSVEEQNKKQVENGVTAFQKMQDDGIFGRGPSYYTDPRFTSPEQQLRDAQDRERRGLSLMGAQMRLSGASEGDIVEATYQARLASAKEENQWQEEIARSKHDERALQDAADQLHQKNLDADVEKSQALLQLAEQQKQQFQSLVVGLFDAARDGGVSKWASGFMRQLEDQMVGNLAKVAWGDPTKGTGISSIVPHANGGFLGKLLDGTMFGADPLKNAGHDLSLAASQLMGAARALSASPSGGGGGFYGGASRGFSSLASGFSGDGGSGSAGAPGYTSDGVQQYSPENYSSDGTFLGPGATSGADTDLALYSSKIGDPAKSGPSLSKGVGIAGLAGAAAYGAYSSFKSGRDLQGISSLLGGAALIPGPQQPFIAAAAMGTALIASVLGDPKTLRAQAETSMLANASYVGPASTNYTVDRYGHTSDYDMSGNMRPQINISLPVQTMDAQSMIDNAPKIMNALAAGLEANLSTRLVSQLRGISTLAR